MDNFNNSYGINLSCKVHKQNNTLLIINMCRTIFVKLYHTNIDKKKKKKLKRERENVKVLVKQENCIEFRERKRKPDAKTQQV